MAFLGLGKKKEEPLEDPDFMPEYSSPVEQVMKMKQQGYTNDQIVQSLQQQGYTTAQISDAMNQTTANDFPQQDIGMQSNQYQYEQPQQQYQQQASPQGVEEGKVQEIVEAVIDEKWSEFAKDIKAVIEWKDKTELKIGQMQQQLADLKMSMDSLNRAIVGKLSDYDKSITEVGTGIKAMEKVFQKVLPSLTDSVNKLERISKKV